MLLILSSFIVLLSLSFKLYFDPEALFDKVYVVLIYLLA